MAERVLRTEDIRFLTGAGHFTDDLSLANEAHAQVLRSPHAHARVGAIDGRAAAALPGVLAVLTGADWAADGLGSLPCVFPLANRDGSAPIRPPRPPLARDRVRHVGDPVALVVAESAHAAREAAEQVEVDYDPLPSVSDTAAALDPAAAQVWEEAPDNLCFDWEAGDAAATEAAFAAAAHVVRLRLTNNRIAAATIEARAAIGLYDEASGRYTLHTPSQGVHLLRDMLCEHVLLIPRDALRVITPDVGGGFGMKMFPYPEQALVLWAARRLARPVRWSAERGEAFLSDTQARDHVTEAELALDGEGRFLGLRASVVANLGAYLSGYAFSSPTLGVSKLFNNTYRVPAGYLRSRGVFTNTVPVEAYRGAGKPESIYVTERLVEQAARELGLDPVELRRRNLVPAAAMPYRNPFAQTYDACDFARSLEGAVTASDYQGFAERRRHSAERGRLRGIGLVCCIHAAAGMPDDMAEIVVEAGGTVSARAGTQSTGQGHQTTLAQVVAERLGVRPEAVRVSEGDSDALARGAGSGGSGTLLTSGVALTLAADQAIDKGRQIAGHLLEAAAADIVYEHARFTIAGTDRSIGLFEAAARAAASDHWPQELPRRLDGEGRVGLADMTYPYGCQVCEVEVEAETGAVRIARFTAVDDYGRLVNPMIVAGQVHGAIAQGVGQALLEECRYDPESGQLLSGSFLDYGLPRADDLPLFEVALRAWPTESNPLGAKGVGELATVGAPPAVVNAVLDALRPLGVAHLDMPLTPERVWRAIEAARGGGGG
ncbi:MAG: xanthine dehydrogenase family protein molybdopterin-binding subunit [Alphaproteobacteria bacterium]|nr:xanthine dehydrogenase family protein molybdopterin-binding subunit [Alphaproteobacteria bacterium]